MLEGFETEQREWLARQFEQLTTGFEGLLPSEWAERSRYLPPQATSLPGFYRFEVTPYLREIVDCMSVDSPIREVVFMKGAQIGATVGVLENAIGYFVAHVKTAPMMLVTADGELAKIRLESSIIPMLQFSGLSEHIRSSDENNARKTGKTDKKLEWEGGGYLLPQGAKNANKLRSIPIQILLRDEVDGWPDVVGKDGDPMKLSETRTAGYEGSRKIFDTSTPTIRGQSKIEKRFLLGDQRRYFVCCLSCGFPQVLRWRHTTDDGELRGIVWETQNGRLVRESVRYLCRNCGHAHFNEDKVRLLSPENGAEWRATADPISPDVRSYHLSALYSPVGMQSWAGCVQKWLEAWDPEANKARDIPALQVFYNNVLGETFEIMGDRVAFEAVSEHRRSEFSFGEIPNRWAVEHCGGPILLLTCAVDVQKANLAVAVFGWARGRRAFLVDYQRFEGDTENTDDEATWGALRKLLEEKRYVADDGKVYGISLTLVDSGYLTDTVYRFCLEYVAAVIPIKGVDAPSKTSKQKEFAEFKTPTGTRAFTITVDRYKDRWAPALRRSWDRQNLQPAIFFNAPKDATDAQLRELTRETKVKRTDKVTGRHLGFEWHRPSGSKNELWDLLVYNDAALDLTAWTTCLDVLRLEEVSMPDFYDHAEKGAFFEAA